jgi:hypothetical protein
LFFHISDVSALVFVILRPSYQLEVLTTCVLSVEVFSMFMQDWVEVGSLTNAPAEEYS